MQREIKSDLVVATFQPEFCFGFLLFFILFFLQKD